MKFKKLLFIVCINITVMANGNSLFLVSGNPTTYFMGGYESCLYKFDSYKKNLCLIKKIIPESVGSECIKSYQGSRLIALYYPPIDPTDITVISMDSPRDLIKFKMPRDKMNNYSFIGCNLISRDDGALILVNSFLGKNNFKYNAIFIKNKKIECLDDDKLEYFKFIQSEGMPSTIIPGDTYGILINNKNDIMIPKVVTLKPRKDIMVQTGFKIPKFIKFDNDDTVVAYCNTNTALVISSAKSEFAINKNEGYCLYYVLNKHTNKWKIVKIYGDKTQIRSFGEWLTGSVSISDESGKRKSAGFVYRNNCKSNDYKLNLNNVDERFNNANVYFPGVLVLYNINTNAEYKILTKQGDSEIILIDNNKIYYRSYDKIYCTKISNGSIGPGKLLIRSNEIPNIHWAFIKK